MESRARLAARVAEIAPFHVMEVQTAARVLEAAGRTVIHMEIGEPDFPTPAPVLAEAQRAIAQGGIYYTSALGLPELREAIASHYADHYGVAVDAERVIVTAGSSAALLLVSALLVNRDDRILLADPGYPCTRHFIRILEGEPIGIPVGPASNYQLTAELIEQNWYDRLAPWLDRCAETPRSRPGKARAEPLHLAADALAARSARLLSAGHAGDPGGAPAGISDAARPAGPGAAEVGFRHSGNAGRRVLHLCRLFAIMRRQ